MKFGAALVELVNVSIVTVGVVMRGSSDGCDGTVGGSAVTVGKTGSTIKLRPDELRGGESVPDGVIIKEDPTEGTGTAAISTTDENTADSYASEDNDGVTSGYDAETGGTGMGVAPVSVGVIIRYSLDRVPVATEDSLGGKKVVSVNQGETSTELDTISTEAVGNTCVAVGNDFVSVTKFEYSLSV